MILFGADNRPPMLDKDLYDYWKSRMELYMQNRKYERMILESVENSPLIWPIVEENGVTRTKKYAELSAAEKIQVDCDMKATNIILQGFAVPVFSPGDDLIACLNMVMAFLTVVTSSRLRANRILVDPGVPDGQAIQTIIPNNAAFQTEVLDTYDSEFDDISNAKAVLMVNISNYGFDVISKSIDERAKHKREYDSRMNERHMQSKEGKVDSSKALGASLVVTECSRTKLDKEDTSSSLENYITHAVDANLKPVNDQVPFAEI
nr:hypothetical protein [Tanacetum cinerariifolium]